MAMTGIGGLAFLLDLGEAVPLRHGDGLLLEDGRIVEGRRRAGTAGRDRRAAPRSSSASPGTSATATCPASFSATASAFAAIMSSRRWFPGSAPR
jgi:hypothetical protein